MTGELALTGGVDAKGLSAPVIPLADGPTLVLALGLSAGSIPSDCPAPRTRTLVVVVWAGGITPAPGADVRFAPGILVDPRGDRSPATAVEVSFQR